MVELRGHSRKHGSFLFGVQRKNEQQPSQPQTQKQKQTFSRPGPGNGPGRRPPYLDKGTRNNSNSSSTTNNTNNSNKSKRPASSVGVGVFDSGSLFGTSSKNLGRIEGRVREQERRALKAAARRMREEEEKVRRERVERGGGEGEGEIEEGDAFAANKPIETEAGLEGEGAMEEEDPLGIKSKIPRTLPTPKLPSHWDLILSCAVRSPVGMLDALQCSFEYAESHKKRHKHVHHFEGKENTYGDRWGGLLRQVGGRLTMPQAHFSFTYFCSYHTTSRGALSYRHFDPGDFAMAAQVSLCLSSKGKSSALCIIPYDNTNSTYHILILIMSVCLSFCFNIQQPTTRCCVAHLERHLAWRRNQT